MGQDQDVADFGCTEVLIEVSPGTVGIEDYELIREVAPTPSIHREVHALGGKLIIRDDRPRRKACQANRAWLALPVLGTFHRPRGCATQPDRRRRLVSYGKQEGTDDEQQCQGHTTHHPSLSPAIMRRY